VPTDEDARAVWLTEAQAVVEEWERSQALRLLSTADAAVLADRIARALEQAFDRGRRDDSR
jgi:hypothetical protein